MKYRVKFSVQYEVEIECKPSEIDDEVADLNIPEDEQTRYVYDTFEVDEIKRIKK